MASTWDWMYPTGSEEQASEKPTGGSAPGSSAVFDQATTPLVNLTGAPNLKPRITTGAAPYSVRDYGEDDPRSSPSPTYETPLVKYTSDITTGVIPKDNISNITTAIKDNYVRVTDYSAPEEDEEELYIPQAVSGSRPAATTGYQQSVTPYTPPQSYREPDVAEDKEEERRRAVLGVNLGEPVTMEDFTPAGTPAPATPTADATLLAGGLTPPSATQPAVRVPYSRPQTPDAVAKVTAALVPAEEDPEKPAEPQSQMLRDMGVFTQERTPEQEEAAKWYADYGMTGVYDFFVPRTGEDVVRGGWAYANKYAGSKEYIDDKYNTLLKAEQEAEELAGDTMGEQLFYYAANPEKILSNEIMPLFDYAASNFDQLMLRPLFDAPSIAVYNKQGEVVGAFSIMDGMANVTEKYNQLMVQQGPGPIYDPGSESEIQPWTASGQYGLRDDPFSVEEELVKIAEINNAIEAETDPELKQKLMMSRYNSRSLSTEETYIALKMQPVLVESLRASANEQYELGNVALASQQRMTANQIEDTPANEIVDQNMSLLAEVAFGALTDPTMLVGPLFKAIGMSPDVMKFLGRMNILAPEGSKEWRVTQMFLKAAEENLPHLQDAAAHVDEIENMVLGGGRLSSVGEDIGLSSGFMKRFVSDGFDSANPVRRVVSETGATRAEQATKSLTASAAGLLNGAATPEDAIKILAAWADDPTQLVKGLEGLTSSKYVESMARSGKSTVPFPVGLVANEEAAEAYPVLQFIKKQLPDMESLQPGVKFEPQWVLAEFNELVHRGAREAYGLNKLPLVPGTKRVAAIRDADMDGNKFFALNYFDADDNIIKSVPYDSFEEARKAEKEITDAVLAVGKGEDYTGAAKLMAKAKPSTDPVTWLGDTQRAILSDMYLNLRPQHWIRNAMAATATLMADGNYSLVAREIMDEDILRIVGGEMVPDLRARGMVGGDTPRGFRAGVRRAFKPAQEGAATGAQEWTQRSKFSPLGLVDKTFGTDIKGALSNVWAGETYLPGGVRLGEESFYKTAYWKTLKRVLGRQWKGYTNDKLRGKVLGIIEDEKLARDITDNIITHGGSGRQALEGYVKGLKRVFPDLNSLSLTDELLLTHERAAIDEVLAELHLLGPQEATGRIKAILDTVGERNVNIRNAMPMNPGFVSDMDVSGAGQTANLIEELKSSGQRAGIPKAQLKKTLDDLATEGAANGEALAQSRQRLINELVGEDKELVADLSLYMHDRERQLELFLYQKLDEARNTAGRLDTPEAWAQFHNTVLELKTAYIDDLKELHTDGLAKILADPRDNQWLKDISVSALQERYRAYDVAEMDALRAAGANLTQYKKNPEIYEKVIEANRGRRDMADLELYSAFRNNPSGRNWDLLSHSKEHEYALTNYYARAIAAERDKVIAMGEAAGDADWAKFFDFRNKAWDEMTRVDVEYKKGIETFMGYGDEYVFKYGEDGKLAVPGQSQTAPTEDMQVAFAKSRMTPEDLVEPPTQAIDDVVQASAPDTKSVAQRAADEARDRVTKARKTLQDVPEENIEEAAVRLGELKDAEARLAKAEEAADAEMWDTTQKNAATAVSSAKDEVVKALDDFRPEAPAAAQPRRHVDGKAVPDPRERTSIPDPDGLSPTQDRVAEVVSGLEHSTAVQGAIQQTTSNIADANDVILRNINNDLTAWVQDAYDAMVRAPDISPQQRAQLLQLISESAGDYDTIVAIADRMGREMGNYAMLDFEHRRGFDSWLAMISPFHYFYTRSAYNWGKRVLSNPYLLTNYYRWKNTQKKLQNNYVPERSIAGDIMEAEAQLQMPGVDPSWVESYQGMQIPRRLEDAVHWGNGFYTQDPIDLAYPFSMYRGNQFVNPDDATSEAERIWLSSQTVLPGLMPSFNMMGAAYFDTVDPRQDGTSRMAQFNIGNWTGPIPNIVLNGYQAVTGNQSTWLDPNRGFVNWGTQYDPYGQSKESNLIITPDSGYTDTEVGFAQQYFENQKMGDPEWYLIPEDAQERTLEIVSKGIQNRSKANMWAKAVGYVFGANSYWLNPVEMDRNKAWEEYRGVGYSEENPLGSREAQGEMFHEGMGSWFNKNRMIPGADMSGKSPGQKSLESLEYAEEQESWDWAKTGQEKMFNRPLGLDTPWATYSALIGTPLSQKLQATKEKFNKFDRYEYAADYEASWTGMNPFEQEMRRVNEILDYEPPDMQRPLWPEVETKESIDQYYADRDAYNQAVIDYVKPQLEAYLAYNPVTEGPGGIPPNAAEMEALYTVKNYVKGWMGDLPRFIREGAPRGATMDSTRPDPNEKDWYGIWRTYQGAKNEWANQDRVRQQKAVQDKFGDTGTRVYNGFWDAEDRDGYTYVNPGVTGYLAYADNPQAYQVAVEYFGEDAFYKYDVASREIADKLGPRPPKGSSGDVWNAYYDARNEVLGEYFPQYDEFKMYMEGRYRWYKRLSDDPETGEMSKVNDRQTRIFGGVPSDYYDWGNDYAQAVQFFGQNIFEIERAASTAEDYWEWKDNNEADYEMLLRFQEWKSLISDPELQNLPKAEGVNVIRDENDNVTGIQWPRLPNVSTPEGPMVSPEPPITPMVNQTDEGLQLVDKNFADGQTRKRMAATGGRDESGPPVPTADESEALARYRENAKESADYNKTEWKDGEWGRYNKDGKWERGYYDKKTGKWVPYSKKTYYSPYYRRSYGGWSGGGGWSSAEKVGGQGHPRMPDFSASQIHAFTPGRYRADDRLMQEIRNMIQRAAVEA